MMAGLLLEVTACICVVFFGGAIMSVAAIATAWWIIKWGFQ